MAKNCVIIADEFVRGTSLNGNAKEKTTGMVVAGKWIRLTSVTGAVCHVLHPGTEPTPDDPKGVDPAPIRITSPKEVVFLNKVDDAKVTVKADSRWIEPKTPLAK